MPIVLKYWSLNLLEPSGPVPACTGIALPLPLPVIYKVGSARLLFSCYILVQKKIFWYFTKYFFLFSSLLEIGQKYRSHDTQTQAGRRFIDRFCRVSESDSSFPCLCLCVCLCPSACSNSFSTERLFMNVCTGGTYVY